MIDFSGKRVVIFGGGDVGARKAAYFCRDAEVTVISRSFSSGFDELPVNRKVGNLAGMTDQDLGAMVKEAFLVVAATSDQALNNRIGRYCRIQGVLFNNADGTAGDIILPAKIVGEQYLIAISTSGGSPAVSRFLREHIEETYPCLDRMIILQERLRDELKKKIPDQVERGQVLQKVLGDTDIWKALESGQEQAWEITRRRYII